MNFFLPICRDLFINFERFLFNWKLLQSTGFEPGLIWTWIVPDSNKEEKKKMAQWLLEDVHPWPLGIVPQPTASTRPLLPQLFSASICWPTSPWHLLVEGIARLLLWVSADPPSGVCIHWCALRSGGLACWGALECLASLCLSCSMAKCKACGSYEKYF